MLPPGNFRSERVAPCLGLPTRYCCTIGRVAASTGWWVFPSSVADSSSLRHWMTQSQLKPKGILPLISMDFRANPEIFHIKAVLILKTISLFFSCERIQTNWNNHVYHSQEKIWGTSFETHTWFVRQFENLFKSQWFFCAFNTNYSVAAECFQTLVTLEKKMAEKGEKEIRFCAGQDKTCWRILPLENWNRKLRARALPCCYVFKDFLRRKPCCFKQVKESMIHFHSTQCLISGLGSPWIFSLSVPPLHRRHWREASRWIMVEEMSAVQRSGWQAVFCSFYAKFSS